MIHGFSPSLRVGPVLVTAAKKVKYHAGIVGSRMLPTQPQSHGSRSCIDAIRVDCNSITFMYGTQSINTPILMCSLHLITCNPNHSSSSSPTRPTETVPHDLRLALLSRAYELTVS